MNVLERLNTAERQIKEMQSLLGITKASPPPKANGHAAAHPGKQKDMVNAVLSNGIPKNVRTITKEINATMGRKEKRGSINAACSKMYRAGELERPDKGVYQIAV